MPEDPSSVVLSKLDYCNSLLSSCPNQLLNKLQKVQNSAARLVFKARKQEHIKPLLQKLHWLPVHSRIQYKIPNLCYNSFSETYPLYLSELLTVYYPSRQLRSILDTKPSAFLSQKQKRFENELFLSQAQNNGTHCHMMSVTHHPDFFKKALKTYHFKSAYE